MKIFSEKGRKNSAKTRQMAQSKVDIYTLKLFSTCGNHMGVSTSIVKE
jgi:hypothetical protein